MGRIISFFLTVLWYSHCFGCLVVLILITPILILTVLSVLPINEEWLARVLPPQPVPAEPVFRSRRRGEPPQRPYVDILCRGPYRPAGLSFRTPLWEAKAARALGRGPVLAPRPEVHRSIWKEDVQADA